MTQAQQPPPGTTLPLYAPPPGIYLKPHRGTAVLVLGILGLVVCFICGIIAWVMGKTDLREMEAGRMDPSGRGLTEAGKICGIISVVLACAGMLLGLIYMIIIFIIIFAIAAAGFGAAMR